MSEISSEDFAFLLALTRNPRMSMEQLAEILDINVEQAMEKVTDLKSQKIISNPTALYLPEALGLTKVTTFVIVPNFKSLKFIEKACDEHPYTQYRGRLFGRRMGLIVQFATPPETIHLINEFYTELQSIGYITKYEIFESTGMRSHSFPDLSKYNRKIHQWDFLWSIWYATLPYNPKMIEQPPEVIKDFSEFDPIKFDILRAITADASISPKEIAERFKISLDESESHYEFILNNFISQIRLRYKREIFDLTETVVAISSGIEPKIQSRIINGIQSNPPPFYLAIDILKDKNILLWGTMSPGQVSDFSFASWEHLPDLQIYLLDTKKTGAMLYWFYPPNFDFKKQDWKKSKSYMVIEPLQRLKSFSESELEITSS